MPLPLLNPTLQIIHTYIYIHAHRYTILNMTSKIGMAFVAVATVCLVSFSIYNYLFPITDTVNDVRFISQTVANSYNYKSNDILKKVVYKSQNNVKPATVSVLIPAWEILVIESQEKNPLEGNRTCLFPNNNSSPAKLAGTLNYRTAFKCNLPEKLRQSPLPQPLLMPENSLENFSPVNYLAPELLRWNYLAYESLTTENDIVLFVKGINNRQGKNRPRNEFRCVINGVRTSVITAVQEVFRCRRPNLTSAVTEIFGGKITLETKLPKQNMTVLVPSVAYYSPPRKLESSQPKVLMCACTMVYNVGKFLKEWVTYHAGIGVEKFVLYDNESDDNLSEVVDELIDKGFNISMLFWIWPKTQEAGFSHCAVMYKDSCTWMMYVDVDEFVYSPKWKGESRPSKRMLGSMVGRATDRMIGQVMIGCYEFGASERREHPREGVTQGYNCRRRDMNRHKSIVLLDAVDKSLHNVVHHFRLRPGYRSMQMRAEDAIVNHYKYQAWSEFKSKYRRRVSAYVVDWTQSVNLASKDRAPGLGVVPVEPVDWPQRYCDMHDNNLRDLTLAWFGHQSLFEHYMAWQR